MSFAQTVALVTFLFPLAYSPGPGNQFFAALGARAGLRGSVRALAGYHLATWLVTIAIGAGVGVALLNRPGLLAAMAAAGGVYMVWLGWRSWRAAGEGVLEDGGRQTASTPGFASGVLLLILNGKAYVIIALMFAAFPAAGDLASTAWVTTVFTLNNLVAFVAWGALGATVARWAHRTRAVTTVDRVFAVGIVLAGLWLVLSALRS